MSKKISDFFKTLPKFTQDYERNEENSGTTAEVKNEKDSSFEINLDEVEPNSPKIRECRVILQDINKKKIKNEDKNSQIVKTEPESESNSSQSKVLKVHKSKQQIKCEYCSRKLSQLSILNHMRNFHSKKIKNSASCEFCDQTCFTTTGLKVHMTIIHPEKFKPKLYECDFDGKTFKNRTKLLVHMSYHQPKVKCELCQIEILPHAMQRHINNKHTKERKFQCKICQKRFKLDYSLKHHIKLHNKSHECKICKRKFSLQNFLTKHLKDFHENPNSFKCETCGKKFNTKKNHKEHQKTHDKNRPKPFKCQRCNYATDTNQNYKKHQEFHERQDKKVSAMKNPIKCKKCLTYCRNKTALNEHMRHVHPEALFQCDLCGKYLKAKLDMKGHIMKRVCQKYKLLSNRF